MSLDFDVVKTSDLPDRFRPPADRDDGRPTRLDAGTTDQGRTRDLPGPLQDLLQEAAAELTDQEREAFLSRIAADPGRSLRDRSRSREEWRSALAQWLKEEATRFRTAAAQVSDESES